MDAHPRQSIRQSVVALLLAARTSAGDQVYPTREAPWRTIELPGIAVYAMEETSQRQTKDSELERHVVLAIHAVAQLNDGIDDALDAISLQVERAMTEDRTLGGTAVDSHLIGTEISVDETAARPAGAVRLSYEVRYHTPPRMT